jgi:uncharacterized protein YjdB
VTFEEGIKQIASCLFAGCTGLEKIEIPDSVTLIDKKAFNGCENLQEIVIPDSVTKVEWVSFANCKNLKEVHIPDTVNSMGTYAFLGCTSLQKVHLPNIRINLCDGTFSGCTSLTEVNLPDTLQTIGSSAFYNCTSLTEINLPENVNTINSSAFSGCTALTKVTIPASMRKINSSAFSHCEALTDLTIAEGTTEISANAFEYCKALQSVTLPDSLQTLGDYAFRYCDVLSEVNIGAGLKVIPSYCFYEDAALVKVILPQQVTTVKSYAFGNCTQFTDVTMNRNVNTITLNAFSYPKRLTIHGVSGTYPQTFAEENDITFVALNTSATAIKLSKTDCNLGRGSTLQLTANITPADAADELTWTSTDDEIVTVDANGLLKGVKVGTASVVAMAGDVMETCNVTVYEKVTSVTLNCTSKALSMGDTLQLTATVNPSNAMNQKVSWSTSDETVATVNEEGLVTATGYGTAEITVTTEDGGYTKKCCITVKDVAVTGITLNVKTATIGVGNTYELIPTIAPENASVKDVTWTSSKPEVATVENGIVTAVSEGTTIIIAKTKDGAKTASCTVTVTANQEGNETPGTTEEAGGNETPGTTEETGGNETPGTTEEVGGNETPGTTEEVGGNETPGTTEEAGGSETPGTTEEIGGSETPLVPNSTTDKTTQNQSSTETALLPVGSVQTVSGAAYKVTKSTTDTKEVTYTAPTNKKKTSIKVPDTVNISGQIYKVTVIADKAFKNNSKLKSVTIGKNITKIGKEAFSGCKKLSKIIIKSTKLKTVGKNAIKGINKKATIKVPKKQLTKYKKLFKSKTGYKKSMKIKK